jgi:hypothetical protein
MICNDLKYIYSKQVREKVKRQRGIYTQLCLFFNHFIISFSLFQSALSLLSLLFLSPEKAGTAADGGATVFSGELNRKTLQNQNFLHQTLLFLHARFKSGTQNLKRLTKTVGSEENGDWRTRSFSLVLFRFFSLSFSFFSFFFFGFVCCVCVMLFWLQWIVERFEYGY